MKRKRGFEPIIDHRVRVLILGSFPSEKSLEKRQYYGHPQNQFWRLVGTIIGHRLHEVDYEERKRVLLAHGIGVWDVIDVCQREGSLDSRIRKERRNDFANLRDLAPKLNRVCFNGKKAGESQTAFDRSYRTFVLPSSSPAHTLSFEHKLDEWRVALDGVPVRAGGHAH